MRIEITGVTGLREVRAGDDLAALIRDAAGPLDRSVIAVVTQKVVSKAEGSVVDLRSIEPSAFARDWAARSNKDARLIELILRQSRRIVKMDRGVLICETHHGFICANAGVDQSNVPDEDFASVLPADPDASASRLRAGLDCGAAIVSDTFGRPWREGLVEVAIGVSGLEAVEDLRGTMDRHGRLLTASIIALADELAAAAGLVMKKSAGVPAALIRGMEFVPAPGSVRELLRPPERDLFR